MPAVGRWNWHTTINKQRFEKTLNLNDFPSVGLWQVAYQAQDEEGTWSETRLADVNVISSATAVSVKARIPRSAYQVGDLFTCSLDVKANNHDVYDVYVGWVYPPEIGYFVTINENGGFSVPNDIVPYRQALDLSEDKTLYPLETKVSPAMKSGDYQCCGVVTAANTDALDAQNWLAIDCQTSQIRE